MQATNPICICIDMGVIYEETINIANFAKWYTLGLKQVLEYSDSGRCQTSTRQFRATRVLALQCNRPTSNNDGHTLCCKVVCGDPGVVIILKLTSRPSLSLLLCSTYLQYFGPMYVIQYARTYVFLHDFTYEIHEKRIRWQPCSISQRQDSL